MNGPRKIETLNADLKFDPLQKPLKRSICKLTADNGLTLVRRCFGEPFCGLCPKLRRRADKHKAEIHAKCCKDQDRIVISTAVHLDALLPAGLFTAVLLG